MAPSRASARSHAASPADALPTALLSFVGFAVAVAAATQASPLDWTATQPPHATSAATPLPALPAAGPVPTSLRGSGGVHVPLLRRNGHLRALARVASQAEQNDIVAGWALREKGRVAAKYGLVDAAREAELGRRSLDDERARRAVTALTSPTQAASSHSGVEGRRKRQRGQHARASISGQEGLRDEYEYADERPGNAPVATAEIIRRQIGGLSGGQLGTAASSSTTSTRTALSVAGYGTATGSMSSGTNNATKTAPTTLPAAERTAPVGEVHLTNYDADLSYYAPIGIGVPAQYMNCILDTGSADLWIASNNCTSSDGCTSTVPLYNSTLSRTAVDMNTSFSVRYGSGRAQGEMMQDYVSFAGYNVSSQAFALVDSVSHDLLGGEISGLMGLGWQPLAASQAVPWWQNLYQGDALPFPGFAVSLSRFINVPNASSIEPGGSLTFGYLNTSLYDSAVNFVSLPSGQESYWLVPMDQVAVNGTNVTSWAQGQGQMAAIDTGTTLIGGPQAAVASIYEQVPGARAATGAYSGYYSYPCAANVSVALTFGGITYNMSVADFNLGPFGIDSRTNESTCLGAFFDLAFSGNSRISWVIGAAFLKNVYSVYRAYPPAVGFATLSDSPYTQPYYPSNSSDPAHNGNLTAVRGGIYGPSGAPGTAAEGNNAGVRTTLVAANTVTTAVQIGTSGARRSVALLGGKADVWLRVGTSVAVATVLGFGAGLLR